MTNKEKQFYLKSSTVGVLGTLDFGGLSVKEIQYGINDHIVYVTNTSFGIPAVHRSAIRYRVGDGRPYFLVAGCRVFMDEIIRVY